MIFRPIECAKAENTLRKSWKVGPSKGTSQSSLELRLLYIETPLRPLAIETPMRLLAFVGPLTSVALRGAVPIWKPAFATVSGRLFGF